MSEHQRLWERAKAVLWSDFLTLIIVATAIGWFDAGANGIFLTLFVCTLMQGMYVIGLMLMRSNAS